jgi:hypothetical protein
MHARPVLVALVLLAPAPLAAQFTTVVTPPRRPAPPVVAVDSARPGTPATTPAAEEQRRQMLDIKAWVDSAAGALAGRPNEAAAPGAPGRCRAHRHGRSPGPPAAGARRHPLARRPARGHPPGGHPPRGRARHHRPPRPARPDSAGTTTRRPQAASPRP